MNTFDDAWFEKTEVVNTVSLLYNLWSKENLIRVGPALIKLIAVDENDSD